MDATTYRTPNNSAETAHTLVLTRAHVCGLMTAGDYLAAAEEAFRALATGGMCAPLPMHIQCAGGGFHAKGARLSTPNADYVAVKVNGNFPGNPAALGLPTIQGAILLSDARNGCLLAVLDSIEITLRRTAAAATLAATCLARPDSRTLAICGCGEQARAQLAGLADAFPLRRVFAWDIDPHAAERFAREASRQPGLEIEPVGAMRAATRESDIIVTCTTARTPFLDVGDINPGAFIAAVGADSPDKSEIAAALMAKAAVVVDVLDQCAVMGDLHHAIAAGVMSARDVRASLGEIVIGRQPARFDENAITIFDSTGTAVQDVAAAVRVYARAMARQAGFALEFNASTPTTRDKRR